MWDRPPGRVSFAEGGEKEYIAGLRLGLTTNTQDTEGQALTQAPVTVGQEELEAVLPRFTGEISQIPPMFSAIKINGKSSTTWPDRAGRWNAAPEG